MDFYHLVEYCYSNSFWNVLANAYSPSSAMAVSTPMKASEDKVFQNFCFPGKSSTMTPASVKRSGLPTPVRRLSGLPAATPKTVPRAAFSPHAASLRQSFSFSIKKTFTAG